MTHNNPGFIFFQSIGRADAYAWSLFTFPAGILEDSKLTDSFKPLILGEG